MPRWRKLHTKTVDSFDFNDMPDDFTRLLWTLLPLGLDRCGRGIDNSAWVRSKIFPLREDVEAADVAAAMDWYEEHGMIERYEHSGRGYFWVPTWHRYQGDTRRESPSDLPAPPGYDDPYTNEERENSSGDTQEQVESNSGATPEQLGSNSGATQEQVKSNSGVAQEQRTSYENTDTDTDTDTDADTTADTEQTQSDAAAELSDIEQRALNALLEIGFRPKRDAIHYARDDPNSAMNWAHYAKREDLGGGFVRNRLDAGEEPPEIEEADDDIKQRQKAAISAKLGS